MTFQIVRISPVHCPIRDGIIGSTRTRLPNAYETLALALRLAGRMEQDSYDGCGDDAFDVVIWGTTTRAPRPVSVDISF